MTCKTLLATLVSSALFGSLPLLDDFQKAQEIARIYEKPLVVVFNLDQVIASKVFSELVDNDFVFVRERKGDLDIPMVILLDPEGREITRIGYEGGPVQELGMLLKTRFSMYQKLSLDFSADCNEEQLESLYQVASELGSIIYKEKILNRGINMPKGVFFPMERYTQLVNRGEKESPLAKEIREVILKRDPNNEKGSRLRLALIDFQEGEGEAKKVVEPLEIYIKEFGSSDQSNLPKIRAIISEYLIDMSKIAMG